MSGAYAVRESINACEAEADSPPHRLHQSAETLLIFAAAQGAEASRPQWGGRRKGPNASEIYLLQNAASMCGALYIFGQKSISAGEFPAGMLRLLHYQSLGLSPELRCLWWQSNAVRHALKFDMKSSSVVGIRGVLSIPTLRTHFLSQESSGAKSWKNMLHKLWGTCKCVRKSQIPGKELWLPCRAPFSLGMREISITHSGAFLLSYHLSSLLLNFLNPPYISDLRGWGSHTVIVFHAKHLPSEALVIFTIIAAESGLHGLSLL